MPVAKSDDIDRILLNAHAKSYRRAFETAVRTGTALIFSRNGKIVRVKPKYKYVMVPIKTSRKKRAVKSGG